MGTKSTTKFYEIRGDEKIFYGAIYCQWDGYLSGHGVDLKKFLAGKKIINGISPEDDKNKCFNGIRCLGAFVIAHLKKGIGSVYLTTEEDTQKYNYEIYDKHDSKIYIKVEDYGEIIYDGIIDNMPIDE